MLSLRKNDHRDRDANAPRAQPAAEHKRRLLAQDIRPCYNRGVNQRIRVWADKLRAVPTPVWVVLLVLPALVPLARAGFFDSHDGLFHVYRLQALDRAVRAGVLYPRWFPDFAFGYGHPVLNFYGPLSYYWGLPFTLLGADAVLALKLVFAAGLIASALGMYVFARLHLGRGAALVAAVVYAYLPYHLVDLYVRGALAEFLAFVWFPLVLWAFHRLVTSPANRRFVPAALASLLLTALVATHSLSALIFAPVLGIYLILLLADQPRRGAVGGIVLSLALSVALSAFYWLPVLAESGYVGLGQGASRGYQDHLVGLSGLFSLGPAYPYPTESGVAPAFPLGLGQLAIIVAALLVIFGLRLRSWLSLFFLGVALVSAFMLTSASRPVWQILEPGLAFLQYPWRFQALTVLATAFLAGVLCDAACRVLPVRPSWLSAAGWLLAAGCLLAIGAWALWRLPYTPTIPDISVEAMWDMDRKYGQIGATWTGEYLPVWVTEQRWAISHPLSQPEPASGPLSPGQVHLDGVAPTRYDLTVDAPEGTAVILHQFHYPGWQAAWQDDTLASRPEGVLALASFDLQAGSGSLTARLAPTPAQLWGTLISLMTSLFVGMGVLVAARRRASTAQGHLLLAACYFLLAAVLLVSLVLPNGTVQAVEQVNANLEDRVELLAYTTDRQTYHPGDTISVTLYWRALRQLDQDYKAFVHLTDAVMTRQPAQHDGDPGSGFTPTTRWLPGELVPDTHHFALPPELEPGRYRLWAGMYEHETIRNLAILSSETPTADGRVLLGEIEVTSP
jgi:hypothetical protein